MPQYAGNLIANPGQGLLPDNNYKTQASSNFGTRQLSFQTILLNPSFGLATNFLDSNSVFHQVIQRIQAGPSHTYYEGGPGTPKIPTGPAELFWIGTPRFSLNTALIKPRATGTVISVDGIDIYIKGREFSNEYVYWGMPIQFAENIGDLEAGVTYYINNWWTENNGNSRIQVSATFVRENYNTKIPTGGDFDTNLTDTVSVTFRAGGYDPIDFTDIQPNWYPEIVTPEDRGWDCLTVAVAYDTSGTFDCGPDNQCDYNQVFSLGIWFALWELFNDSSPDDVLVIPCVDEYGIFSEQLVESYILPL